ncbi:hypothetical protein ACL9RF_12870 [Sphingobacterium sp. Mn56C]|uniref:hypothetical protein n=1 Tax=Sphingobacterium sp. Mn56C TaxID=3395261 RepID=UPI003BDC556D
MVENSTTITDETYDSDLKENSKIMEIPVEDFIKQHAESLLKEPSQTCIDTILLYSKSYNKA